MIGTYLFPFYSQVDTINRIMFEVFCGFPHSLWGIVYAFDDFRERQGRDQLFIEDFFIVIEFHVFFARMNFDGFLL